MTFYVEIYLGQSVKTMVLAILDQGSDLNDEQFMGHRILDLKTLSAICFNTNNQQCMAVWTIRIRCLICCSRSLIQIWAQELRHFTIPFLQSGYVAII